jgi:hypothetical protein
LVIGRFPFRFFDFDGEVLEFEDSSLEFVDFELSHVFGLFEGSGEGWLPFFFAEVADAGWVSVALDVAVVVEEDGVVEFDDATGEGILGDPDS